MTSIIEEQQQLIRSAWLLYENRERILNNPCMAYAPIHVQNCLAYITDDVFKGATLGTYVEWWGTELGRRVDKQGVPYLALYQEATSA